MPWPTVRVRDNDRKKTKSSKVTRLAPFVDKLWKMVEDPETDELISWGKSRNTFIIKNQADFAKRILSSYFKHSNMASFNRQLNHYGFRKILPANSDSECEIGFTHSCFARGNLHLLAKIRRPRANNPKENVTELENNLEPNEAIESVLNDVQTLKERQEHLCSQLSSVKQANEVLKRELFCLSQIHGVQPNLSEKEESSNPVIVKEEKDEVDEKPFVFVTPDSWLNGVSIELSDPIKVETDDVDANETVFAAPLDPLDDIPVDVH